MHRTILAAPLVALVILGVACGGAAAPAAPAATPTPTRAAPAPTAAPTPTAGRAAPAGKLVFTVGSLGQDTMNPLIYINRPIYWLMYNLHNGLFQQNQNGEPEPVLVKSWKLQDDQRTWDFTLVSGVKFHNGDDLTAEDAKFTWDNYSGLSAAEIKGVTERTEAVSPTQFRVVTKNPYPLMMHQLGYVASTVGWIVPKKYYEGLGADDKERQQAFEKAPIGSGPYRFVSRSRGESYTLEALPTHWRNSASVKTITRVNVPDNTTAIAQLKVGEADIVEGVAPAAIPDLRKAAGVRVLLDETPNTWWLDFFDKNDPTSPLRDKRVRQAVSYALNIDAIIDKLLYGTGAPNASLISPLNFGFDPGLKPYGYNPAKAKQLLAEAGYPNGLDLGKYWGILGDAVSQAIIADLAQVGIKAQQEKMDSAAWVSTFTSGKFKGGIGEIGSTVTGDGSYRVLTFFMPRSGGQGQWSYTNDPRIPDLYEKQKSEMDQGKRADLLKQVQRVVYDDAIVAFLYRTKATYGVRDRVNEWPQIRGMGSPVPAYAMTLKQ